MANRSRAVPFVNTPFFPAVFCSDAQGDGGEMGEMGEERVRTGQGSGRQGSGRQGSGRAGK